ncbi:MAG: hydantoinase/carbamoylase family amidase [Actinobacteria bacterium]|nr:hydantoinase/carbamoylase family amidase [Actinomycetota bacterium]
MIDGDRLLASLEKLRTFGGQGKGVVRPTFSDQDMAARRWLKAEMADASLDATIDGVGNVFGRSKNPGPTLLIGSHSDTQPEGGWLDGAMGVMYAIEIARSIGADQATEHLPIDVVAWADEEGTYCSFLGSRSYVGELPESYLADTSSNGESVGDAVERVGLSQVPGQRFRTGEHIGYLEAHIEQGPHLEDAKLLIGVVTSIVGIHGFDVSFTGEQNHAGTTPMSKRKDAAVAMFGFGVEVQDRLTRASSAASVWTIGDARIEPGAESIVPGYAELVLQMRDGSDDTLAEMDRAVLGLVDELNLAKPDGVKTEATSRRSIVATEMDTGLQDHIRVAAEANVPGLWQEMPSAAGHDPMVLSRHMPCAMLFIPSIGGISHDFAEDSAPEDIVMGCQVLADAAVSILTAGSAS